MTDYQQEILDAIESQNFEYKAVSYDDFADYSTGLATETAANWQPVASTNRAPAVGEEVIIITYRRPL